MLLFSFLTDIVNEASHLQGRHQDCGCSVLGVEVQWWYVCWVWFGMEKWEAEECTCHEILDIPLL